MKFAANQKKRDKNLLEKPVSFENIYEQTRRYLRPVGNRLGIIYWLCKVLKNVVGNCSPFGIILSGINIFAYKSAKFMVPI